MFSLNFLKTAYIIGGTYDTILGIGIIFLRSRLSSIFNIQNVNVPIIADALGLFLLGYGVLLLHESIQDEPQISVGLLSALIRFFYAIFVIYYFFFQQIESFYIILAFTDFLTGFLIIIGILKYKKYVIF